MDQYDEFGNYIGGDDSDEEDDQLQYSAPPPQPSASASRQAYVEDGEDDERLPEPEEFDENGDRRDMQLMEIDDEAPPSNQIVLHEDKRYYTSAEELYGPEVEAMVQEEDTQPLTEPVIKPIKTIKYSQWEKDGLPPDLRFSPKFMFDLMKNPASVRNIAVVGHLHHGKTSLLDMLVYETHKVDWDSDKPLRYTDTLFLAQERGISLKSSPMSLVLPSTKGKSYLLNVIDTPGHTNFQDEVASSLRLVDGAVVVVDAVEGVLANTEAIIRHLLAQRIPFTVVVNKVDRLILELRLPPDDAYFKLKLTVEEVNTLISEINPDPSLRLSPEKGNVAFASTSMGWCFTLGSFAKMYADTFGAMDLEEFSQRLWGNIFFDPATRKFTSKLGVQGARRSFVHFILEPLYKLYAQVLGEDQATLKQTLGSLGIFLKPLMYKMDTRPLLRLVLSQFFGPSTGLVDMVTQHIPDPSVGARAKVESTYSGPLNNALGEVMLECDAKGPLVVQVTKLYPTADAQDLHAFGRVISGTARRGERVKVLGQGWSEEDQEDMVEVTVGGVWSYQSRYALNAESIPAGNLVLLGNIDASITKTATVISSSVPDSIPLGIFRPIKHMTQSVLKVAIEPMAPSELPKMLDGLRKINKTYPLAETKVEESGEHIVLGTGELYLDSIMHDLRRAFAEIEIKISDPVVKFAETVVETSALKCYAETPNKKNKLTMISEPLEKGIPEDIETGRVHLRMPAKQVGQHFQDKYGWDLLAARSIWAFGPDENGPNVLMNDTLPSEVDRKLLGSVKDSIKQGFQWAAREGPLADEPMRGVKFRILDASLAQEAIYRGGGQIIPTARRVCYSSFLLATPRLLEPVYEVEVQCPTECVAEVYTVLATRRGHVISDRPKPGSPLVTLKALIPVIDSAGFEVDLRTHTAGQAFCLQYFDHWDTVPGDPTDKSIKLRPLEPAQPLHLARDFTLKTRRRKGLGDEISVSKYLENDLVIALAASGDSYLLG